MISKKLSYFARVAALATLICLISGCAQSGGSSDDGEWASGNPDGQLERPVATPTPNPSPTPVATPLPTPIPQPTVDFTMSSTIYTLAHDKAKKWDGCSTHAIVKGGYNSDTSCGAAYVYPEFGEHLNDAFMACIDQAAYDTGYPQPVRVFIRHLGSYNDRNSRGSSSLSMHAYARALDIATVRLFDVESKLRVFDTNIMFYSSTNAKFYDAFRACWKKSMPAKCTPGQREYSGSIGHPDSAMGGNTLHNDHIHLSFPFCAG